MFRVSLNMKRPPSICQGRFLLVFVCVFTLAVILLVSPWERQCQQEQISSVVHWNVINQSPSVVKKICVAQIS